MPFFATLFLWRLSSHFFNPNGILALIPIFYHSAVKERGYFLPMAVTGCFLLDRNSDTMLFWTSLFCLSYAVLGLQNFINPASQRMRGIYLFMFFAGLGFFMLGVWAAFATASLIPLWTAVRMFALTGAAYLPATYLFERIECWTRK
jgi:uncharacterized membrane protein YiaA